MIDRRLDVEAVVKISSPPNGPLASASFDALQGDLKG